MKHCTEIRHLAIVKEWISPALVWPSEKILFNQNQRSQPIVQYHLVDQTWSFIKLEIGGRGDKVCYQKGKTEMQVRGFSGGAVVESLPANAGDTGSSPGLGGSHMPRSN